MGGKANWTRRQGNLDDALTTEIVCSLLELDHCFGSSGGQCLRWICQLDVLDLLRHCLGCTAPIGTYELTTRCKSQNHPLRFEEQRKRLGRQVRCKGPIWRLVAAFRANRRSEKVDGY